ncbi:MAG: WD40 repeat domain-containing protein [Bdellovibrionales bacterium]
MSTANDVEVPIIRPLWLNVTEQPVLKVLTSTALDLAIGLLADGRIRTASLSRGETQRSWSAHALGVLTAAVSPDGRRLATTGEDNQLKIFDLESGDCQFQWKNRGWIDQVLWADQDLIFCGTKKLWRWSAESQQVQILDEWEHSISALSLKNSTELGCAGYSRISLYDLESGKATRRFEWKGQLESLIFSPRERYAVCASQDLSIHIWDLKKDKDLSMRGFPAKIRDLSFRPDGLYMANASGPEVVIWDYMDPGPANKRPQVLGPFEKDIRQVRYQNRGKMLASFGEDGVILFWRPDLFEDRPLAIAGIRDQAIESALWTEDDRHVLTGLQTGYMALYPVPEVQEGR